MRLSGEVEEEDGWDPDSEHLGLLAEASVLQSIEDPDLGSDTLYGNINDVLGALHQMSKERVLCRVGAHDVSKFPNSQMRVSANRPFRKVFPSRTPQKAFPARPGPWSEPNLSLVDNRWTFHQGSRLTFRE